MVSAPLPLLGGAAGESGEEEEVAGVQEEEEEAAAEEEEAVDKEVTATTSHKVRSRPGRGPGPGR